MFPPRFCQSGIGELLGGVTQHISWGCSQNTGWSYSHRVWLGWRVHSLTGWQGAVGRRWAASGSQHMGLCAMPHCWVSSQWGGLLPQSVIQGQAKQRCLWDPGSEVMQCHSCQVLVTRSESRRKGYQRICECILKPLHNLYVLLRIYL